MTVFVFDSTEERVHMARMATKMLLLRDCRLYRSKSFLDPLEIDGDHLAAQRSSCHCFKVRTVDFGKKVNSFIAP